MRLVVLGLALALTAQAPLAAQTHVPTQPLAQGEVLLEVNAIGVASARADRATLMFTIRGTGESDAAAQADAEGKIRDIRALLRAQGILEADIRIEPPSASGGDPADQAMAAATAAMNDAAAAAQREAGMPASASGQLPPPNDRPAASSAAAAEVVVRSIDRLPAIMAQLNQHSVNLLQGATYALSDDSGPRRQARLQAMEKARANAETYASALNMRVVRVLRVTERRGMDVMALAASDRSLGGLLGFSGGRGNRAEVPSVAVIGVDFALAPR